MWVGVRERPSGRGVGEGAAQGERSPGLPRRRPCRRRRQGGRPGRVKMRDNGFSNLHDLCCKQFIKYSQVIRSTRERGVVVKGVGEGEALGEVTLPSTTQGSSPCTMKSRRCSSMMART